MSEQIKVMVIAGGEWQIPLIKKAKSLGYFVINTNLYSDSPGFQHSDIGLIADVLDREKNLQYARDYQPDAVITDQSDIAVPTVAYLCDKLSLPGITLATAELFTNKYLMRKFCSDHNFPTPSFKLCHKLENAQSFVETAGYPVVVKPPSNQASRGVSKVVSEGALVDAYNKAKNISNNDAVLVEKFISGIELTVDGIQTHDGHVSLATSCKSHYKHNSMIARQLLFSNRHKNIDYAALHFQHDKLVNSMGLNFGLTHAEYICKEGVFYLVEIAARGGGAHISSHIVPIMSGIDNMQLLIEMSLGHRTEKVLPEFGNQLVALEFLDFRPGVVKSILGFRQASRLPGVIELGLTIQKGSRISPAIDDSSRHGHVIVMAESRSELDARLTAVKNSVTINYD